MFSVVRVVRCDCGFVNIMLLVIHCFGSGQVFLLSQLQLSVSVFCGWLFLIICALCLVIIDLTLFMQL